VTIRDQIAAARARLVAARIVPDEAGRDATLLARHVLGWDAASLLSRGLEESPDGFADALGALISRRERREPVAYIRGTQEFWGRALSLRPGVLIPRPETELIVEEVLHRVGQGATLENACDVGTGSGCLAVTLAAELPNLRVSATDVSALALDCAKANADRHGVTARIDFILGSYLATTSGPLDLIVSNPPYIAERDYASLAPEVRDFEPREALVGGPDGLRDIRELVRLAPTMLREKGLLILEMGHDQSARVTALVSGTPGLRLLQVRPDLQGYARVAVAQRSTSRPSNRSKARAVELEDPTTDPDITRF
jgi:release factor glutamine methyltransferase